MGNWRASRTNPHFAGAEKEVYSAYLNNRRRRGKTFALPFLIFCQLISRVCHYCGAPPRNVMRRTYFTFLYSGIDRKDNEKGYTEENCVPCCKRCNGIKGEWLSYEEMLEVGGLLKNGFKNL